VDGERRDQRAVGADEHTILDNGAMLGFPVEVAGHRAGSHVD